MVTTVGTEKTFEDVVRNLLILEHDAIAAYDSTIEKLDDAHSRQQISAFRDDHRNHVAELTKLAGTLGIEAPQEGDLKAYLTTGKIALASLVGDKTILKAMSTNEIETKMAYDQAANNTVVPADAKGLFQRAFADEDRHKAWMDMASTG